MKDALEGAWAFWNKVPAPVDWNVVYRVGAKERPAIPGSLCPGRIVGKSSDHTDRMAARLKESAQGGVVWADANHLGAVVDSPDGDLELITTALGAVLG